MLDLLSAMPLALACVNAMEEAATQSPSTDWTAVIVGVSLTGLLLCVPVVLGIRMLDRRKPPIL